MYSRTNPQLADRHIPNTPRFLNLNLTPIQLFWTWTDLQGKRSVEGLSLMKRLFLQKSIKASHSYNIARKVKNHVRFTISFFIKIQKYKMGQCDHTKTHSRIPPCFNLFPTRRVGGHIKQFFKKHWAISLKRTTKYGKCTRLVSVP